MTHPHPSLDVQPQGFMFDLDGTLILSDRKLGGYTVIPGAVEVLNVLEERGIPFLALTNGSAYPSNVQGPRLRDVGLPIRDERLFTPNSVAAGVMKQRGLANVLVLGTAGVVDALEQLGVTCCVPGSAAAAHADGVYVAWHPDCTMDHIHAACSAVLDGAAFLTASDVPFFATKEGKSFGYSCAINGAIARVTGIEPEPTGKPSAHAMRFVAAQLGLAIADVGVVGDDAVAEMQMARAEGAIGIAVTSGSTDHAEWAAQPDSRKPHLVIDHVGHLLADGLLPR